MRNFNKLANLHRVFFKRADRFNSFESGDKGQGKYKPGPPSGNTLGGAAPPPSPAVATPAPQAQPAPPPVPTPAALPHVPTGIPGYQIEKTVRDAGDFGKSLGDQLTGYHPDRRESGRWNPSRALGGLPENVYLSVKRDLGLDKEWGGRFEHKPGPLGQAYRSLTGTGTDDLGTMLRKMNPFSAEYQSSATRDAEKSTRDMQRMNDQFANPFGRPDVLGATDGYGGRGNPLKLPPSQLPPQMRGVLEHEAPHLNKPPFIPPASPTDDLQ